MRRLKLSTSRNILVFMTSSADHVSGKTGLTLTITESKAAAAFASTSPTVTERVNGWYQIALTGTNTNTLGDYALHITGTDADPTDVLMEVVAVDDGDSVRFGLTALPNAAAEASGGLFTRGTGAGQIRQVANGMIDANAVRHLDTAYATPTIAGVPEVDPTYWNGGAIVAPNVTGIPKVDPTYWNGGAVVAPAVTGIPKVDPTYWRGGVIPATSITGVPKVDVSHILGVAAPDLSRVPGLLHDNSVVDEQVYGDFGITSARVRVFADSTAALAATKGAADNADGEVYRFAISASYDINGLDDYRLVREL